MLAAAEMQLAADLMAVAVGDAGIYPDDLGVDRLQQRVVPGRIAARIAAVIVALRDGPVQFQDHVRGQEQVGVDMGGVDIAQRGVAHHHVGEGIGLQRVQHVQALDPRQVIEPVAVLQLLHLVFEDEAEGGAQHPAEFGDLLGQAADPQIDLVQPAPAVGRAIGAAPVQKVQPVGVAIGHAPDGHAVAVGSVPEQQQARRLALVGQGGGRGDRGMVAIGGDEIRDRERVLQVLGEFGPACIGLQIRQGKVVVKLRPRLVQRRHAGVARPRDVQRGQIQRQAQQVAAQRRDDEFVDLAAHVGCQAADQRRLRLGQIRPAAGKALRVQESLDQGHLLGVAIDRQQIGAQPVHRVGQHRMAEAIHRMGEFRHDRGVDIGRIGEHEGVDPRLDAAGEFLEHHVLILHLGRESGRLEHPVAVPDQGVDLGLGRGQFGDRFQQPFVDEGQIAAFQDGVLVLLDDAVVLGMKDRVDGLQGDVLVPAPVARRDMQVQHLVVIGGRVVVVPGRVVRVRCHHPVRDAVAVQVEGAGRRVMGDVHKEGHA